MRFISLNFVWGLLAAKEIHLTFLRHPVWFRQNCWDLKMSWMRDCATKPHILTSLIRSKITIYSRCLHSWWHAISYINIQTVFTWPNLLCPWSAHEWCPDQFKNRLIKIEWLFMGIVVLVTASSPTVISGTTNHTDKLKKSIVADEIYRKYTGHFLVWSRLWSLDGFKKVVFQKMSF